MADLPPVLISTLGPFPKNAKGESIPHALMEARLKKKLSSEGISGISLLSAANLTRRLGYAVILKMLKVDPRDRISAEELMDEPWLAEEVQKARERMGISSPVKPALVPNETQTATRSRKKRARGNHSAAVDDGLRRSKRHKTGI